nr:MAG TPA: hypothetical protein [Bacteriophage sp.]
MLVKKLSFFNSLLAFAFAFQFWEVNFFVCLVLFNSFFNWFVNLFFNSLFTYFYYTLL